MDGGDGNGDAGESDIDATMACDDLEDAARHSFAAVLDLACIEDSDCVWTTFDPDGWCISNCGTLTNDAGVASAQSAAISLCRSFVAQGCKPMQSSCRYAGPFLCAGGTCASYLFYLGPYPLPTITHGACTALEVDYDPSGGSPNAPRDLVVSLTASNGTLYADPACTMPLTTGSLTIQSGTSSAAFGFLASAPGVCLLDVDGGTYRLTAQ